MKINKFFENQTLINIFSGTDLSESNKEKSKKYARENNLPEFDYVLQPRTKGFTYAFGCVINFFR